MQYVTIKQAIVEQVETGMLSPGQKLPAERQLAEAFNTTRVTLREALSLLEAEGRIYREDRRGWFIAPPPLRYDPAKPLLYHELAQSQHRRFTTELLSASAPLANKQATQYLALKPFSDVYDIERVCYLEKRPVMYMRSYARMDGDVGVSTLLDHDLTLPLIQLYREHYSLAIASIRYAIRMSALHGEIAQALRATVGTSALVLEKVYLNSAGEPVFTDIEYWRHDAIAIESSLPYLK